MYATVKCNPDAILINSILGIGHYSSLVIASEIADIERFNDSHKLCAYAGVVPSVRNSADIIHHSWHVLHGCEHILLEPIAVSCFLVLLYCHSGITKFYNSIKKKRGSSKAAVAGASKILRGIYWMLKERGEFVEHYS